MVTISWWPTLSYQSLTCGGRAVQRSEGALWGSTASAKTHRGSKAGEDTWVSSPELTLSLSGCPALIRCIRSRLCQCLSAHFLFSCCVNTVNNVLEFCACARIVYCVTTCGKDKVYWMEPNAILTEMNWSETRKATCAVKTIVSVIIFSQIFSGHWHVEINHAVARRLTLKWKYGLQEEQLRRKSQSEALNKVHEMKGKVF